MAVPPKLRPGDTVGVIAPSGAFDRERLAPGLAWLRKQGFRVREGQSLYARDRYLAGRDEDRAADVNAMFADSEVRAIFAARGGYGSARILGLLDWAGITAHPKALVGFSDTTALQLAIFARAGLVSFSGLALCSDVTAEGVHPATEFSVLAAVCEHQFGRIEGLMALKPGAVSGPLIGGCLSLVASLVGTPFFPDTTGAVLALEDVKEPPYRVDRMLNQMQMAGVFDRAAGVVFGQFEKCDPDKAEEGPLQAVLDDFAARATCPVYAGLPYGHAPGRRVLPLGVPVRIEDGHMRFEIQAGGVHIARHRIPNQER